MAESSVHGPRHPARRVERWTLPMRIVLLLALAAALWRPTCSRHQAAVSAVLLLDGSASISDEDRAREVALGRDLLQAVRPPHALKILAFARDVRELPPEALSTAGTVFQPGAEREAERQADTDLGRALARAAGLLDPQRTRRILVMSDGRVTRGDANATAALLAREGVRVDVLPLGRSQPTRTNSDTDDAIVVTNMSAPADIRPRAPFELVVGVSARSANPTRVAHAAPTAPRQQAAQRLQVTLTRETGPDAAGAPGEDRRSTPPKTIQVTTDVTTGSATARFTESLVDGDETTIFRARVRRHDSAAPEAAQPNSEALLPVVAVGPARVLILAARTNDTDALARALRAHDLSVETRTVTRALAAHDLAAVDLVVLADAATDVLPTETIVALNQAVRDGVGLLVTAGPNAIATNDGSADHRFAALLPVVSERPERHEEPTLALALVIDRSGSMAGMKMELTREAARATAQMLPPDDQLAVIAFDSQASSVVRLQRAANRLRILGDIARISPSGGTNIFAGLREAVDQLTPVRARKKHIILLSDGQSPAEGIPELVDAATAARITISAVGVGDGADRNLLGLIANRGGGRFHETRDPTQIPRIFTHETSQMTSSNLVERPTRVVARKRSDVIAGLALQSLPALDGYVRARARSDAEVLLAAADAGDPLLVRWFVGLGQVVVWTSDLGERWSTALARTDAFPTLWGQVARVIMRPRASARFPLTVRKSAGIVEATIDAVGDSDVPLTGLSAALTVRTVGANGRWTEGPPRHIPMSESAPGRYTARFDATAPNELPPAALMLAAVLEHDGRPRAQGAATLSLPLVPELHPAVPSTSLDNLAALTGGRVVNDGRELFTDAPPSRLVRPLSTAILLAAACLFVLEMVIRRLTTGGRATRAAARTARHQ